MDARLKDQGWNLRPEILKEVVEESEGSVKRAVDLCLHLDLRKAGAACLPENVNRDCRKVEGTCVLQIVAAADVARPSRAAALGASSKARLLRLKLTDGKTSCTAVEYKALGDLEESLLVPGSKVRLQAAAVRSGVILLDPKCIQFLGGEVEALKEAWEAQQKYSSQPREGRPDGDEEKAPRFSLFRPSKGQKVPAPQEEPLLQDTVAEARRAMPPASPSQAANRVNRPAAVPQGRLKNDPGPREAAPQARPAVAVSNGLRPQLDGQEKRGDGGMERRGQNRGQSARVDDSFGHQRHAVAAEPPPGPQASERRSQNLAREEGELWSVPNGQARRGSGGEARGGSGDPSGRNGFSSGPGFIGRGAANSARDRAEPDVVNSRVGIAREGGTRGGVPSQEAATEDFPPGFGPPARVGPKHTGGPEQAVQIPAGSTGVRGRQGDDISHRGSGRHTGPSGGRTQQPGGQQGSVTEAVPRGPTLQNGGTPRQQDSGRASDAREKALKSHERPRPGFAPYRPPSFFLSQSSSEATQAQGSSFSEEQRANEAQALENQRNQDSPIGRRVRDEAARAERNASDTNREGSRQSQGLPEGARGPRNASLQNRSSAGGRNRSRETGYHQGAELVAEGREGPRNWVDEEHQLSGRPASTTLHEQDWAEKKGGEQPGGSGHAAEGPGKSRGKLLQKLAEADERTGGRGRGRGRGRPRRGFGDSEADDQSLTLDQWEAIHKQPALGKRDQMAEDERLARQLQAQFNGEGGEEGGQPTSATEKLARDLAGLFTYDRPSTHEALSRTQGRGRGGRRRFQERGRFS